MTYNTFLDRYVRAKSKDEDIRRREFILNLLLLGSLALSIIAFLIVLGNLIISGKEGMLSRLVIVGGAFVFFALLYLLSRKQFHRFAAIVFILTYFVLATYTLYVWGILLHIGLLLYALIIVATSVLLGTRFAFLATSVIIATLFALAYSTVSHTIEPSLSWTQLPGGFDDAVTFSIVFVIITVVSWLSNRETERSLERARRSEKALKEQRDKLEILAEKRAQELRKAQQDEILHMYQFAEIGKMASALIHDLINPLTSLSLSLEKLENKEKSVLITRAINGAKLMDGFIQMARKEIKKHKEIKLFSAEQSIRQTISALQEKAKKQKVTIDFRPKAKLEILGNSVKFQEIISNLISNAIDSFDDFTPEGGQRPAIIIELLEEDLQAVVTVSDNGKGIAEDIIDKIYEPFFTTKNERDGLGLGLAIVKDIIDKQFNGSISVSSQPGVGTSFLVRLPIKQPGT